MSNKIIQEKRMKGYFIQAAKEMLKGEGLKSISVRNIADQAGYSYATLYNYFKDIKDLFFECVNDFQDECEEFVKLETKKTPQGVEKIKAIIRAYSKYFIQYPNIFELFYLEKISDIDNKQPTSDLICNFLDKLCAEEWNYCIKEDLVNISQAESIRSIIKYQIPGLLLLHLNRKNPSDYNDFLTLLDKQLDKIVKVDKASKKIKLTEPEILNFIFGNCDKNFCFIHYTKDEEIANKIINEGFRYVESFYNTAEQVTNDTLHLTHKHNTYKLYGNYIVVICISNNLYNFFNDELKKIKKNVSVENILTEQSPILNDNNDYIYFLPKQFIKGYLNYETGKIEINPSYNPNYNPPIFYNNLKELSINHQ